MLPVVLWNRSVEQQGALSREQLLQVMSVGQLERAVRKGDLVRVASQVYAIAGAKQTWMFRAFVATLSMPGSALSERSAARLWGLSIASEVIAVNVPRHSRKRKAAGLRIHTAQTHEPHIVVREALRVTIPERMLYDLGGHVSEQTLRILTEHCLNKKLVTVESLRCIGAELGPRRPNTAALTRIIDSQTDGDAACESFLERKVLSWMRQAGLPEPVMQKSLTTSQHRYRPDARYLEERIIIEVDGPHHLDPIVAAYDRRRRNELSNQGQLVLVFGLESHQEDVIEQIANALATRRTNRVARNLA